MSLSDRDWTIFAIDAEVDSFGVSRIVKEHNYLRAQLAAALARAEKAERTFNEEVEEAVGQEQARWQERFNDLHITYGVDGGGCDSDDPLDFTEAEVRGSLCRLEDRVYDLTAERDDLRSRLAAMEEVVKAAEDVIVVNGDMICDGSESMKILYNALNDLHGNVLYERSE